MNTLKLFTLGIFTASALMLSGCGGGGGGSTSTTPNNTAPQPQSSSSKGVAQLGNLAGAKVKIYKIENDRSLTLKWQETTSNGDNLKDIGKFNTHDRELEDKSFYLYEVSGGDDWDSDDDGVKDSKPTKNLGKIRAIAKGGDVISLGDSFRVTAVSEVIYKMVAPSLKSNFDPKSFNTLLEKKASLVLKGGNLLEALSFDPVNNKSKTDPKLDMQRVIESIHKGETPPLGSLSSATSQSDDKTKGSQNSKGASSSNGGGNSSTTGSGDSSSSGGGTSGAGNTSGGASSSNGGGSSSTTSGGDSSSSGSGSASGTGSTTTTQPISLTLSISTDCEKEDSADCRLRVDANDTISDIHWSGDGVNGMSGTPITVAGGYSEGDYSVDVNVSDANGYRHLAHLDFHIDALNAISLTLDIDVSGWMRPSSDDNGTHEIKFVGESNDTANIISWSWDLGDGLSASEQNSSRTYSSIGLYRVELTATDVNGFDHTATADVNITDFNTVERWLKSVNGEMLYEADFGEVNSTTGGSAFEDDGSGKLVPSSTPCQFTRNSNGEISGGTIENSNILGHFCLVQENNTHYYVVIDYIETQSDIDNNTTYYPVDVWDDGNGYGALPYNEARIREVFSSSITPIVARATDSDGNTHGNYYEKDHGVPDLYHE